MNNRRGRFLLGVGAAAMACTAYEVGRGAPPFRQGPQQPLARQAAGSRDANEVVLTMRPSTATAHPGAVRGETLERARDVISRRLDLSGIPSPSVNVDRASNTLTARIPRSKAGADMERLLSMPGILEFRHVRQLESEWLMRPLWVDGRQTGFEEILGKDGRPVSPSVLAAVLASSPGFTSADLMRNSRVEHTANGARISFEFEDSHKKLFEDFTRRLIGKKLAVMLDHRLLTAPTVNDAIRGKGLLETPGPIEQADRLAILLNSGPLPMPLVIVRRTGTQ